MTFFANATFQIDITDKFEYKIGTLSTNGGGFCQKPGYYLRLDKLQLSHTDYLKIKSMIITLRIKQNNYDEIEKDFEIWKNAAINISWTYQTGGENFFISHKQPIIVLQSMQQLRDAIPKLNPLYSTIHQLPSLQFQIFNDFELPNGFLSHVNLNILFNNEIKQKFYMVLMILRF